MLSSILLFFAVQTAPDLETVTVRGAFPNDTFADRETAAERTFLSNFALSLIETDPIQLGRAVSVSDLLQTAPGVIAQPRFGPLDTRLSIRGSGLVRTGHGKGTQLRWGFIPINQSDGNFDAQLADAFSTDYILVARGAGALKTGSSSLGGSIDLIPLTGQTADRGRLRLEAGSFGYYAAQSSGSYLKENLDWYGSLGYLQLDGFREQSASSQRRATTNVGWKLSDNWDVRALVNFADIRSKWPGTVNLDTLRNNPREANPTSVARNQGLDVRHLLTGVRSRWEFTDSSLQVSLGYHYKEEYHPTPGAILELDSNDVVFDILWESLLDLNLPSSFTANANFHYGLGEEQRFSYAGPPSSELSSQRGNLVLDQDRTAWNLNLAAFGDVNITDQLLLEGGIRQTLSYRKLSPNRETIAQEDIPAFYVRKDFLAPFAGLVFAAPPSLIFFGNVYRGFEAASFFDLGGNAGLQSDGVPRLNPQTSTGIDVGTRGRFASLNWDATFYHQWIQNELLRLDPAAGPQAPIINADRTQRTGLELAGSVNLLPTDSDWSSTLRVHYNWMRSRFRNDSNFGNNTLAGLPEHILFFGLKTTLPNELFIEPTVYWLPEGTWVDHNNSLKSPSYVLYGLRTGQTISDRFKWFAEARNIADRRYAASVNVLPSAGPNTPAFFPGDGRGFYTGIEILW